jgi:hypothetical protein
MIRNSRAVCTPLRTIEPVSSPLIVVLIMTGEQEAVVLVPWTGWGHDAAAALGTNKTLEEQRKGDVLAVGPLLVASSQLHRPYALRGV